MLRMFAALLIAWMFAPSLLASDASEIFKTLKCEKCHSIDSLGIAFEPGEPDEDDDDEEEKEPVDLSKIGANVDAAHIVAFLKREVKSHDNEKKHKKKFKGTEEEMQAVADWLASLK